jgi:soluble lytic murein transglycosylase
MRRFTQFLVGLLVVLLIALAVATFRGSQPGTVAIPLSPSASATSTPVLPSPTPTLTPAQHEAEAARLLAEGLQAQTNGDYELAIGRFVTLATLHPSTTSAPEADFQLGKCYAFLEQQSLALGAFKHLLTTYPASPRAAPATYLAGAAAEALGDHQSALAYYQDYARMRPMVSGYVQYEIGDILAASGALAEAVTAFDASAKSGLPPSPTVGALQRLAELRTKQKDHVAAAAIYEQVLQLARSDWYRPFILDRLAASYLAAGNPAKAQDAYLSIIFDYPASAAAASSLTALDKLGARVDTFQRATVLFNSGQYAQAITTWRGYIDATTIGDGTAWARYYIGLSYQRQDNCAQAIPEFDALVQRYPKGPILAEARLAKARCLTFQGNATAASAEYLSTARIYTGTTQAELAYWQAGLGLYRAGNVTGAISVWEEFLTTYPRSGYRVRALFWDGKSLLAQSKQVDARKRLTEASLEQPPGHYAQRASELLTQMSPAASATAVLARPPAPGLAVTPTAATTTTIGVESDRPALESWLTSWAPAAPTRAGATDRLRAEPHFARAMELAAIGLDGDAAIEFGAATDALGSDPWSLLEMIFLLRSEGQHQHAISAAGALLAASPTPVAANAPPALQRLLYPTPYRALAEASARRYGVDPLLLQALVRQESLFSAAANSSAEARGLTQVIPATARSIATALGNSSFQLRDLFRPNLSLDFGAYYLGEMLRLTKGDAWMALAAYNAGYGNAMRWAGGEQPVDPDLFLENLDFAETRTYLEAVARNYRFYLSLYGPAR